MFLTLFYKSWGNYCFVKTVFHMAPRASLWESKLICCRSPLQGDNVTESYFRCCQWKSHWALTVKTYSLGSSCLYICFELQIKMSTKNTGENKNNQTYQLSILEKASDSKKLLSWTLPGSVFTLSQATQYRTIGGKQKQKQTAFLTLKASLPLTPAITPVPHLKSQLLHFKALSIAVKCFSSLVTPWKTEKLVETNSKCP